MTSRSIKFRARQLVVLAALSVAMIAGANDGGADKGIVLGSIEIQRRGLNCTVTPKWKMKIDGKEKEIGREYKFLAERTGSMENVHEEHWQFYILPKKNGFLAARYIQGYEGGHYDIFQFVGFSKHDRRSINGRESIIFYWAGPNKVALYGNRHMVFCNLKNGSVEKEMEWPDSESGKEYDKMKEKFGLVEAVEIEPDGEK